jgi:hypothetical protein
VTKYSGADWLKDARKYWKGHEKPMSAFAVDVADILGQVYGGIYHMDKGALIKADYTDDERIQITIRDSPGMATHDGCELADLVMLCFLMNIRLDIDARAFHYLRLNFARVNRHGFFRSDHPNLDEAVRRNQNHVAAILDSREA